MATTIISKRKFSKEKFKIFHPGGNIGSSLQLAKDIMVVGKKLPIIDFKKGFSEALKVMNEKKLGVVVILNNGFIAGLVTDGDLRREMKFISKKTNLEKLMTQRPFIVNENMPAEKALSIMNDKRVTSLLVVSDSNFKRRKKMKLKGIIHIHFLLKSGIQWLVGRKK